MRARNLRQHAAAIFLLICLTFLICVRAAFGQTGSPTSALQIRGPVDETILVTLEGNTHPLALPKFDRGLVPDSFPMQHMYLELQRSPQQEEVLAKLLGDMQNPSSPNYHHWLTADQLGRKYGPAQQDIETVMHWLTAHGLQVNGISKSGLTIDVSGTAGQVREAFRTEIHQYNVNGKMHIANSIDPQIPAALANVVAGFSSLNDFLPRPAVHKSKPGFTFNCEDCPDGFMGSEIYNEAPGDFATIYNVVPLYKAKKPITGKGQTVVVLEDSNIRSADVTTFRKAFGLSGYSGKFTQIHPGPGCTNPGTTFNEDEAALDAEWAGAVAPDANVELASCADSSTNPGPIIAAQNLLDLASPPPIMSLSFISCEADNGPGGNLFIDELWQQAALEGVSVFVAAGDGGPAGCEDFNTAAYAQSGIAANALASTPFDVATGGTDFLDTFKNQNSKYWSSSNTATHKSVKSYVPEMPWDTSCANSILDQFYGVNSRIQFCNDAPFVDIVAASGAPSFVYAKPSWQKNLYGNPNDGVRDLPDVSLFASDGFWFHGIMFCMSDVNQGGTPCNYSDPASAFANSAGGTSFTAPQFASIQALINQKAGGRQGNPDPVYYALAKTQYGTSSSPNKTWLNACNANLGSATSSACLFHDVTTGDIAIPCFGKNDCFGGTGTQIGVLSTTDSKLNVAYPAKSGWDFSTGIGTVNVTNIVNKWP